MSIYNRMTPELAIIIIEDDYSLASALAQFLGIYYRVKVARDSTSALSLLENETFDVAIIDKIFLGGLGTSLIQTIQSKSLETATIVLTGDDDFLAVSKALLIGADDYLVKTESLIPQLLVRIPVAVKHAKARAHSVKLQTRSSYKNPLVIADVNKETYQAVLKQVEREYLLCALTIFQGDTFKLARQIGISRSTLFRKFAALKISLRHPVARSSKEIQLELGSSSYV